LQLYVTGGSLQAGSGRGDRWLCQRGLQQRACAVPQLRKGCCYFPPDQHSQAPC
jgi:hypothetical protein